MSDAETLRAGAMSVQFADGGLRYFRVGETEVLRRVYVGVRDETWGTIPGKLTALHSEVEAHSFYLVFRVLHENADRSLRFEWEGSLVGSPDGSITFSMEGEALTDFKSNRIGFCVLHPASAAGHSVRVLHTDGSQCESVLPKLISPHQPFLDLRGITHQISEEQWLETRFTGDVFEMEDQRNWTDASYKTYSRPLALPYPFEVVAGERFHQSVSVRLVPPPPEPARAVARFVSRFIEPKFEVIEVPDVKPLPLPKIGFHGFWGGEHPQIVALMSALKPAHLRTVSREENVGDGQRAFVTPYLGRGLDDVPSEVALSLTDKAERQLRYFCAVALKREAQISRILLTHENEKTTDAKWIRLAKEILRPAGIDAPIYGGTVRYFTDLNRERPDLTDLDGVTYSINPQVHAFDDASLVETFGAIPLTVQTARSFVGDLPISVSPVTLLPQYRTDSRQATLFGAGWTLGAVEALTRAGVDSTTFYDDVVRKRGLMDLPASHDSDQSYRWVQEVSGAIFPLYYVFRDLADFVNGDMIPLTGFDRLQMIAMRLKRGSFVRTLYANLTSKPIRVLHRTAAPTVEVLALDSTNLRLSMTDPEAFRTTKLTTQTPKDGVLTLALKPHAYFRVDESVSN